jgi:hypothetical protein
MLWSANAVTLKPVTMIIITDKKAVTRKIANKETFILDPPLPMVSSLPGH